jgi:hypothetical protein
VTRVGPVGRTHAVVIGGSLAGLAAARVLSGFTDRVSVLAAEQRMIVAALRNALAIGRSVLGSVRLDSASDGASQIRDARCKTDPDF